MWSGDNISKTLSVLFCDEASGDVLAVTKR